MGTRLALLSIMLVALLLRLYGIHWGLPDANHVLVSYHPDEVPTMLQAEMLGQGLVRPQQFIYGGTLYFKMVRGFLLLGDQFTPLLDQYNFTADGLLAARYFLVYLALLTLLLLYAAVRTACGNAVALVATALLAITPSHVIWAQRLRPDEIGVFFVVLQLFFAIKVLQAETEKAARTMLWGAALVAGFMLAFRFPLVLFFAMPMLAWLLRPGSNFWGGLMQRLLPATLPGSLLLIVAGYAMTSPETFTSFAVFKAGMQWQWQFQSNPFADAVGMGPIPWQYWWGMLHQALGYPFYFLALAGVVLALYRRRPFDWIVLAGLLPYAVMVSMTTWVVVRYTLPLVPLLVVLMAELLQWSAVRLGNKVVAAVVAVAAGVTLWATLAFLHLEAGPNVRELTRTWITANIPPHKCLLLVKAYEAEEMYNPFFGTERCNGTIELDDPANDYRKIFAEQPIDYVLLHQHHYASMERLGAAHPDSKHGSFYTELMDAGFSIVHEERLAPVLWGVDFTPWFSSLDLTYTNPDYRVYQRMAAPATAQ